MRPRLRSWSGDWLAPQLATRADARFSDPDWLFERKLDGVRVVAGRDGGDPVLWSRNHNRVDASYPEIVEALAGAPERFVIDGEVVAFDGDRTSFPLLQRRMHLSDPRAARRSGVAVHYVVFDLLALGGVDLARLPLRVRKRLLAECFDFTGPLRFSEHRRGDGEDFYRQACARGWEGLIAKRADRPHRGGRSRDWLKFPCLSGQEFVVGGRTAPKGSRTGFGALLVGYFEGDALRFAGKVGTGYDEAALRELSTRLDGLARRDSPFADRIPEREVRWADPELVVQVAFTEWTPEGRLRHPRFLGVRDDKTAAEVVRER
ncbi:non-homologous end-joining DNA ligase [Saccharopolyspora sp. MS10]|uniref:non-homologous end-joining DNA ligase n=1 Tax=Saccharopolyspora sp. MS10 TaxID=3385973 RepID=UPI0039A1B490